MYRRLIHNLFRRIKSIEDYKIEHTINDISLLPTTTQLRKTSQSLAMLDAILMPEWDYRYFSFDKYWDEDEMMASMRDGEGDEYYILFQPRNAVGKVYTKDMPKMASSEIKKIENDMSESDKTISYVIAGFLDEEAFDISNASFFFWRGNTDKNWTCTQNIGDLPYLKFLLGDALVYKEWAEEYYEKSIDLDIVKKIMKHSPLTSAMVETLNSEISIKKLSEDIDKIGYPLWRKKGKRKTLPDNFEELLEHGDIESLKKVFDICELDAYGGGSYWKQVAIAYSQCPDELTRWLVEKGADLHKENYYGDTPLQQRADSRQGGIKVLLELGANVNQSNGDKNTPLHVAADAYNLSNMQLLLEYGADINAKNSDGMTALEYALLRCENISINDMVETAKLLLHHGTKQTPKMKKYVQKLGEGFEFHRDAYDNDSVEDTSNALDKLYKLFDVEPVQKRVMHDNKYEIIITGNNWKEQFNELWELLIPSSGHTTTVQGEVIRIAGRIADEVDRNGGANWDSEYKKMGKAFLQHIGTGEPLSDSEITKLKSILSGLTSLYEETDILVEYAVKWVSQNTLPVLLSKPDYER